MSEHAVRISTAGCRGTVTVDGIDVSRLASTVTVHVSATDLPLVMLGMPAAGVDMDLEAARVAVTAETHALLERLGWTPPDAADGSAR